jgi:hypothetical protein
MYLAASSWAEAVAWRGVRKAQGGCRCGRCGDVVRRFGPSSSDVGVAVVVCRRRCLAILGHRRRAWLHLGQLLPSV